MREGGRGMKSIYISLPIAGHEDTYEQRLDEAVEYVKAKFPEYNRIVTPKEVAMQIEELYKPKKPKYKDYLFYDIEQLYDCDAIFMCKGWFDSKGCLVEHVFALAIGVKRLYQ